MGLSICGYKNLVRTTVDDEDECFESDIYVYNDEYKYQLCGMRKYDTFTGERISNVQFSYSGYSQFRREVLSCFSDMDIEDYWRKYETFADYDFHNFNRKLKISNLLGNRITTKINPNNIPFLEMLCFSDCEGEIGHGVCKKLYKDFEEYENIAKEKLSDFSYNNYQELKYMLYEIGESKSGCLTYH